jgi:uncharacterized protein (TIGR02996 family)
VAARSGRRYDSRTFPDFREERMAAVDPFLAAILANPDEDSPRLAYADHLERQGDPRGEFIRLQCELGRAPDDAARVARSRQLLAAHRRVWDKPFKVWKGQLLKFEYRRGFVERILVADVAAFLEMADVLYSQGPVTELNVTDTDGDDLAALAASPYLAHLTALHLGVTDLKPLDLGGQPVGGTAGVSTEDAAALAGTSRARRLRSLVLRGHPNRASIGPEGMHALATSANLAGLTLLDLSNQEIGDEGARALAGSRSLSS